MDGPWFFYLVLTAIPGVIVVGAIWLQIQASQMAGWPRTPGRIVVSTRETREMRTGGMKVRDSEPRNFAKIVYEYTIAGQTYRCDRVTIGEDSGNFEVAETLARYPAGKTVTVYYNPSKRSQAVLEPHFPSWVWKGLAVFVAIYAAFVFGTMVGYRGLVDTLTAIVGNPAKAPLVAVLIGFAMLAALIVYAVHRHVARMRRWPTVPGRIESAEIRAFKTSVGRRNRRRWVTRYRREVIYSYEVGGVGYTGSQIGTTRVTTTIAELSKSDSRYARGAAAAIHYNAENPAESIVDPSTGPLWLLWLMPAAMLALAWLVGR